MKRLVMDRYSAYCRYYQAQSGGEIPVFRGGFQSGEGLGDFFRGLLRHIAPIALRAVSSFAGRTLDAHQKGSTLKDAAKQALLPTLQGALKPAASAVVSSFNEHMRGGPQKPEQTGTGRMIHHSRKTKRHTSGTAKHPKVYKKVKRLENGQFAPAKDHRLNY